MAVKTIQELEVESMEKQNRLLDLEIEMRKLAIKREELELQFLSKELHNSVE